MNEKELVSEFFEKTYDLPILEEFISIKKDGDLVFFVVDQKPFIDRIDTDRGVIGYEYPGVYAEGYIYSDNEIELSDYPIIYDEQDLREEYEFFSRR